MADPNSSSSSSSRQELSGAKGSTEEEDSNRDSTKKSKRESAGYLIWYRHSGEESIERIPYEPVLQRVRSEEEVLSHIGSQHITHLVIKGEVPDLSTLTPHLQQLRIRQLTNPVALDCFSSLAKLEKLDIRDNNFSDGLPDVFTEMRSLKELNVSSCRLTTLPHSFSSLAKLEKLDIRDNNFSNGLPDDVFTHMRSLKELYGGICGLTTLPRSFSFLTKLEKLNISYNPFSGGLPDIFTEMRSLKEMNVRNCNLTTFPQSFSSLTKLEKLDISNHRTFGYVVISYNNFSDGLPDIFTQMRSLKELNASSCSLTTLPPSVGKLTRLETLNLIDNDFQKPPAVVYSLSALKTLLIRDNNRLKTISQEILQLTTLTSLDCSDCSGLVSPPQVVHSQGWPAIRKFFLDLEAGSTLDVSVAPVAVLGATMGGKTSLVRSLQAQRQMRTARGDSSVLDEVTRVFKIENLQLNDSLLKFIDFGGHGINNFAYQLTLTDKCVPLLVVNMMEFNDIACRKESKEATRQLCFNWLAQVYLSCPRLGPPILVLTHRDQLSDEIFALRRIQLLEDVEEIRQLVLEEEKALYEDSSDFCKIEHLSDTSLPVFAEDDIFAFSDDQTDNSNIIELLDTLELRCNDFKQTIPALWDRVSIFVERQTSQPYILVSDMATEFPDCDVLIILRYLHNIGKILWFEKLEGLSVYIFHQIEVITDLVGLLFNHTADADWSDRMAQFSAYKYKGRIIYKAEYEEMVEKFLFSGLMDEAIMSHLLEGDTGFPPQVALQLLRFFFIIHGPVRRDLATTYIIPYMSTRYMDRSWKFAGQLQLRMEIAFYGRAIPEYIYQLMSVEVLSFKSSPTDVTTVYKNGVEIHQGETSTYLVHDYNNSKVTVQVSTTPQLLGSSWQRLLNTIQYLLRKTTNICRAARPVCLSFCSHCLFLREPNPNVQINPMWFQRRSHTDGGRAYSITSFTGTEPVMCCNTDRNEPIVPKPLRFPCLELTAAEISRVEDFLSELEPHHHTPADADNSEDQTLEYLSNQGSRSTGTQANTVTVSHEANTAGSQANITGSQSNTTGTQSNKGDGGTPGSLTEAQNTDGGGSAQQEHPGNAPVKPDPSERLTTKESYEKVNHKRQRSADSATVNESSVEGASNSPLSTVYSSDYSAGKHISPAVINTPRGAYGGTSEGDGFIRSPRGPNAESLPRRVIAPHKSITDNAVPSSISQAAHSSDLSRIDYLEARLTKVEGRLAKVYNYCTEEDERRAAKEVEKARLRDREEDRDHPVRNLTSQAAHSDNLSHIASLEARLTELAQKFAEEVERSKYREQDRDAQHQSDLIRRRTDGTIMRRRIERMGKSVSAEQHNTNANVAQTTDRVEAHGIIMGDILDKIQGLLNANEKVDDLFERFALARREFRDHEQQTFENFEQLSSQEHTHHVYILGLIQEFKDRLQDLRAGEINPTSHAGGDQPDDGGDGEALGDVDALGGVGAVGGAGDVGGPRAVGELHQNRLLALNAANYARIDWFIVMFFIVLFLSAIYYNFTK